MKINNLKVLINKKLHILLFSMLISFNSWGEKLVCSSISEGEVYMQTYTREGDLFVYGGQYASQWSIVYETDHYLALVTNHGNLGKDLFHYDKLSKEYKSINFGVNSLNKIYRGKCESIP